LEVFFIERTGTKDKEGTVAKEETPAALKKGWAERRRQTKEAGTPSWVIRYLVGPVAPQVRLPGVYRYLPAPLKMERPDGFQDASRWQVDIFGIGYRVEVVFIPRRRFIIAGSIPADAAR
jgi:hypothetical protein